MREGWEIKKLGDLTEVITKGTTPTSVGFEFEYEGINFVKIESITSNGKFIVDKFAHISSKANEALKRSQLKEGDILFSIAGALGRTAIVTNDILPANTNQALSLIRLKFDENVLKEYILSALTSGYALEQVEKFKGGVAQQNLSLEQMKNFLIPIPPIQEQQKIVAILDQSFAAIDQAKANIQKNIENAKELFQSKLNDIFSQKDDGWEEKTLGEIANVNYGYTAKSTSVGDYRYVRITDIDNNGELDKSGKVYVQNSLDMLGFVLEDNDLLMARTGATFAKVLLYKNYEPSIFASYLIKISFTVDIINELYWYFTKSGNYWKQANNLSSGSAQPHFNGAALKKVKFCFPIDKVMQERVIKTIKEFDITSKEIITFYKQKLESLEELKKSILQKAFSGELTNKEEFNEFKQVAESSAIYEKI